MVLFMWIVKVINKSKKQERDDRLKREERAIRMHYEDRADRRATELANRELFLLNANQDRELEKFKYGQQGQSRREDLIMALFGLGANFLI